MLPLNDFTHLKPMLKLPRVGSLLCRLDIRKTDSLAYQAPPFITFFEPSMGPLGFFLELIL